MSPIMMTKFRLIEKECFKLYIGNKSKLTKFIKDIVYENCGHESFFDVFAGNRFHMHLL